MAGLVPFIGPRSDLVIAETQIKQDSRRYYGYPYPTDREPDAPLLQVPDRPRRGVEAKGAPACQDHRVDLLDQGGRAEQVGLSCAWSRAPDVYASYCARLAKDYGAARPRHVIGIVTNPDTGNTGEASR